MTTTHSDVLSEIQGIQQEIAKTTDDLAEVINDMRQSRVICDNLSKKLAKLNQQSVILLKKIATNAEFEPVHLKNGKKKFYGKRQYGQATSCRKEVWRIVESSKDKAWVRKFITDYPDDAVGLKVPEIRIIMELEERWKSSSDKISAQIQNQVYYFIDKGKMKKNKSDKRCYIP